MTKLKNLTKKIGNILAKTKVITLQETIQVSPFIITLGLAIGGLAGYACKEYEIKQQGKREAIEQKYYPFFHEIDIKNQILKSERAKNAITEEEYKAKQNELYTVLKDVYTNYKKELGSL